MSGAVKKDSINHFKYITTLLSLDMTKKETIDSLKVFSEYVSSNKNFKYNKTYLSDSIDPFIESIKIVQGKYQECKAFADMLSVKYKNFGSWRIIVDNIFLIDTDFRVHDISDLVENSNYKGLQLKKILSEYNLYSQDKNKMLLKYISQSDEGYAEYTTQCKIGSLALFSLVEKTLTTKKVAGETV